MPRTRSCPTCARPVSSGDAAPTREELLDACEGGAHRRGRCPRRGRSGADRRARPAGRLGPGADARPGAAARLVRPPGRAAARSGPGHGPHPCRVPVVLAADPPGLAKYGIEEAYELVEAIEEGDRDELREELGDVLLQVVFHARIAQEGSEEDGAEPFSIDDVAGTHRREADPPPSACLRRRDGRDPGGRQGALAAHQGRREAADVGDRRSPARPARPGARGQAGVPGTHGGPRSTAAPGEGIGYELLALAVRAEAAGVDPEAALRAAARAYRDAIRASEAPAESRSGTRGLSATGPRLAPRRSRMCRSPAPTRRARSLIGGRQLVAEETLGSDAQLGEDLDALADRAAAEAGTKAPGMPLHPSRYGQGVTETPAQPPAGQPAPELFTWEFATDPYPAYAWLREHAPVHRTAAAQRRRGLAGHPVRGRQAGARRQSAQQEPRAPRRARARARARPASRASARPT